MTATTNSALDLSSWAERNKRADAHRDAERLEVATNRPRNGKQQLPKVNPLPLELEPVAKSIRPGRETVRNSDGLRAVSLSPSARHGDLASKRAQYEKAHAEYDALIKREKSSKKKKDTKDIDAPAKRTERLPSLPIVKQSPRLVGDGTSDHPSARTPPPVPASTRSTIDEPLSRSAVPATYSPLPVMGDDTDQGGYASEAQDDDPNGRKKHNRIKVIVRKRPLNDREGGEDCVDCIGTDVLVNNTKLRVDLTEYQESHNYAFDGACNDNATNREVYEACGRDLITTVFEGGAASCFAFGQTGSGKTYTMMGNDGEPGLYVLAAEDIFARCQNNHRVFVSLYEIYCNSLFDLLNQRTALQPREDANRRINICGLTWHEIRSVKDLLRVIDRGAMQRRTGSTSANEFSSRSHAVMTISLRDEDQPKFFGCLNVVDLAGSERAADTAANDKQTRLEGAEINKSLLALKECIRGLDEGKKHIQFRGSKLTEVLRDSFVGNSRTVMIATVSPSSTNAEHTLNTLRYAFRVKGLSIDCPLPSKVRNAPRPTQRSKSTDVDTAKRLDKEKETKDKEKKKRGHKRRTPRERNTGRREQSDAEITKLVEERVKAEMDAVREEQRRSNELIHQLMEQLAQMRHEQQHAAPRKNAPSRLPPLDGLEDRPRSEHASRQSRRRHHSTRQSPLKGGPNSSRTAAEIEEVVTLEELAA
jgi:hypothetical protein